MLPYKLNKTKDWWQSRALREQRILLCGGGLLIIVLFYLFIYAPFFEAAANMRQRIATNEKTYEWMNALNKEINDLQVGNNALGKNKMYSPVALISLLQNQINKAGIKEQLTQLKQANKDAIEMHFQSVEFDKLSLMLIELAKTQNIRISQIAIKREATLGKVTADILVSV